MENSDSTRQSALVKWFKRIGVAGFLFFFIKGLLWLIIPFLIGYSFWR